MRLCEYAHRRKSRELRVCDPPLGVAGVTNTAKAGLDSLATTMAAAAAAGEEAAGVAVGVEVEAGAAGEVEGEGARKEATLEAAKRVGPLSASLNPPTSQPHSLHLSLVCQYTLAPGDSHPRDLSTSSVITAPLPHPCGGEAMTACSQCTRVRTAAGGCSGA